MIEAEVISDQSRLRQLAPEWEQLLRRSCNDELMASPLWLLSWWSVFGPLDGRNLQVIALRNRQQRLVGIAPLLWRRVRHETARERRAALGTRYLELIGSGELEQDETCSDYIGIVAERGLEQEVASALASILGSDLVRPWDVLLLPMMSGASPMPALLGHVLRQLGSVRHDVIDGCPYLLLPDSWEAFLQQLTSSTRYLARRSLRAWNRWAGGPPVLSSVSSIDELPEAIALLRRLHRQRWQQDGSGGAFESPLFCDFHDRVMRQLLERDGLRLHWLSVNNEPIVALYNLRWRGRILFYQTGRRVDLPRNIRAGLVIHLCAIRKAIEDGDREYDFLSGASALKIQLARELRPLHQILVTRRSPLNRATTIAVSLARALKQMRSSADRAAIPPSGDRTGRT